MDAEPVLIALVVGLLAARLWVREVDFRPEGFWMKWPPVLQAIGVGIVSALVWMLLQYCLAAWELLWLLPYGAAFAWWFTRISGLTFWGWFWRASLVGFANLVTQNVVLLGFGLDEAYMVRLVPEVPPELPGSLIGYVMAWVKHRRR